MPQRQGPKVLIGSLNLNYWRFIIKSEMHFNLKDPYAMTYLKQFKYQFESKNKQKSLHPNHEYKIHQIMGVDNHSYVSHKWLNDMEYKFYLHDSKYCIRKMNEDMAILNDICDNQRIIDGYDDELEDEDKELH